MGNGSGQKPETPQTAPVEAPETKEAPKQKVDQWSVDALKVKAEKAMKALMENKGVWEKVKGVFSAFFEDIDSLETEESKAKTEAAAKVGAELNKTDTKKLADALAPSLSVTDAAGKVQEAPEVVRDILSVAVDTAKALDDERAKAGKAKAGETIGKLAQATDKVDPQKNPEKKPLDLDDKKLVFCYGARLVIELKKKYSKKDDFKKVLDEFDKATEKAPIGFHTLKTEQFKALFKFGSLLNPLNLRDAYNTFEPLLKKAGIGLTDIPGLVGIGKELKTGQLSDSTKKIAAALLPATKEPDRLHALQVIGQIMTQKEQGIYFPSNEQLAEVVFSLDDKDLLELSNIMA